MAHQQIHRMDTEDEVELHVDVVNIGNVNGVLSVLVRPITTPDLPDGVWLPEGFIDYMYDLVAGAANVLYVPVSIAKDAGLMNK